MSGRQKLLGAAQSQAAASPQSAVRVESEWREREPPRHSKPVSPVWQSVAVNTPDTQTDRETQRETPTTHLTEQSGCEGNGKSESQISDSHEYSDYEITTVGNYYGAIRVRQHHGIFTKCVFTEYIERLKQSILVMKDIDSEVGRTRGVVVSSVLFWRNCIFMSELIQNEVENVIQTEQSLCDGAL